MTSRHDAGFSTIELLITLFVLAAFLIAGVQLYNVVINDGGASRAESRAANLAYNYLRQQSPAAENPCTPSLPVNSESIEVQGLVNVTATVTISCPYGTSSEVSKVEASITYNNPPQTVTYATYVTDQADGEESSVTDGLVAWWRLNGNAEDFIGSADGTVNGAVPATGADGRANGAYSFDGVNDYIEVAPTLTSFGSFSVSAWARGVGGPSATDGYGYILHRGVASLVGSSVYWIAANGNNRYSADVSGSSDHDTGITADGTTWRLITLTYDGTTKNIYVDGQLEKSDARSFTNTTAGTRVTIGGTAHNATYRPFDGQIDDVRVYNRTLSASEVLTMYSEGAF